jgi:tetratricopeptide (TPR) repeat protein
MPPAPDNTPELQKAEALFKFGNDAALKNNFKYAVQMYSDACKIAPGNLAFRQALRGIERRKFNNDPSKVGMLVGTKTQPIKLRARAAKGNWSQVLEICEEAFVHNPWDVGAARQAAEAAEQLGLLDVAQWLLESVLQQAGNDAEFYRFLARIFQGQEQWQKAIACWDRVRKLDPTDETASRQINALSASATITRSGLHQSIDKHREAVGRSGPEPAEAPSDSGLRRRQALTPEQRFEQEIQEDPDQIRPYLDLADQYKGRGRLDEARDLLARGLKTHPNDTVLAEAFADVQMARLQKAIDGLTRRTREHPDDAEAQAKLAHLSAKLNDYELAEYRRRVALHPDEPRLHYELGVRLARVGQHDAAIAEFQQCRSDPELKVQALHQAGLSFEANGVPKLAERSYQEALKAAEPDDQDTRNALHYRLGRVAEAMGNRETAEEHYHEVAANDYGYLDVAHRLRNLHQ